MCPTLEELEQPYLKNLFVCRVDRVDDGSPVFRIEVHHSIAFRTSLLSTSTHHETLLDREHLQQLEAKINALRNELVTVQTNIGEELRQHMSEIQNITTMVRQILEYVGPK